MKFFTLDWWMGNQTFIDEDPLPAYNRHLQNIRNSIPVDFLTT